MEAMWSSSIGHGNQWEELYCIGNWNKKESKKEKVEFVTSASDRKKIRTEAEFMNVQFH
jgi:hypothetical protein